jgi:hypothetical protein
MSRRKNPRKDRKMQTEVKSKPPGIPAEERKQAILRKQLGHDFAIKPDAYGRSRLVAGTAESQRQYEQSPRSGIIRLKDIDPLVGISSLSVPQRKAGLAYRDDYQACAREGLKAFGLEPAVDGGNATGIVPAHLLDAFTRLRIVRKRIAYREMVDIMDGIVGEAVSLRSLEASTRNPRVVIVRLLKMALDSAAVFYGYAPKPKRAS